MTHEHQDDTIGESQRYVLLDTAVDLVGRYVGANPVPAAQLAGLIGEVHQALLDRMQTAQHVPVAEPRKPAVSIAKSVTHEAIICLDCGATFKSLKRHIGAAHGLTPKGYRIEWSLPADYPMVAPAYSEARSKLALSLGLGRISPNKKRLAA